MNEPQKNAVVGTTSFTTSDKTTTFTVKNTYLNECPEPEKVTQHDHIIKYNVLNYTHNPSGPAIINHNVKDDAPDRCIYVLNGELLVRNDPEQAKKIEKMEHDANFNRSLEKIINE